MKTTYSHSYWYKQLNYDSAIKELGYVFADHLVTHLSYKADAMYVNGTGTQSQIQWHIETVSHMQTVYM